MTEKKKGKYPPNRLAGLTPFKPGAPSPNPGGRPRQHREAVAYLRERMDGVLEAMIDIVRRGKKGKLTVSDRILSQHLEFIWQAAFGKHPQSVLLAGNLDVVNPEDAGGLTALLARARLESERRAEHRAPRLGPVGPSSKPDFIVDSAGLINQIAAPAPPVESTATRIDELYQVAVAAVEADDAAPSVESAPPAAPNGAENPSPAAETVQNRTPPPFQVEPDPPPTAAPTRSAPAKPAHPGGNIPGFGEFLSEKAARDADAERARKVEAARAQGRPQISREEAFPPDPREPPEVVTLGRVAGGRGIRRV